MKHFASARAEAGVPDLPPDAFVILSYGMGVDSTSLLLRLILDVGSRWFRLEQLVVLIAVVGPLDEYARTQRYLEKIVFPILARHRIRTVQLARASGKAKDGYLILDDTRTPTRLHRDRARWSLYRELIEAATVPSVSSTRRSCSDKAKHWVLDRFIADEFGSRPFAHLLGFGAHERTRADRDRAHATALRHPAHPLLSWGWDRGRAEVHLRECVGSDPGRSACSYCPFSGSLAGLEELLASWRAEPAAGARALMLEFVARCVNKTANLHHPRSALATAYKHREELAEAIALFEAQLEQVPWVLVEVRRVIRAKDGNPQAKGAAARSVRRRGEPGPRARVLADLEKIAARSAPRGAVLESEPHGVARLVFRARDAAYPAAEHTLTAVPAVVHDKERPSFATLFESVTGQDINATRARREPAYAPLEGLLPMLGFRGQQIPEILSTS